MEITVVDIADSKNYEKKDWAASGLLFFSDEWESRHVQCLNFINSHKHEYKRKFHARKCKISEVGIAEAKLFLNENHIQGANSLAVVYFGLYNDKELTAIMSLGRHSRQIAENRIVLDRFCVKKDVHIQGGASKLFSRCIEWSKNQKYDEIISFSDNRFTEGNIYKILGFSLEKEYKPDYCYVDPKNTKKRLSKQSQKKSASKCPEGLTEFQWCEERGLKKLWDRGKKRWVYSINPSNMSWKQKLSSKCANQHKNGSFKHSHIRGYFKSDKCKTDVYYASSYEMRCLFLLENDNSVKSFNRADVFVDTEGHFRNPDLHVEYVDGKIGILEVKPKKMLLEQKSVQKQVEQTRLYCLEKGYVFKVWSEEDSGFDSDKSIVNWAKKYIAETTGNTDWIEKQKLNNRKRAKKHYHEKTAKDTVNVFCEYCKLEHTALRLTYEKNIERNGRYICEREGGSISGKTPKKKLENPYAVEGKKKCLNCGSIKLLEEFGNDKTRSDGKSTRCKKCRAEIALAKYRSSKNA